MATLLYIGNSILDIDGWSHDQLTILRGELDDALDTVDDAITFLDTVDKDG